MDDTDQKLVNLLKNNGRESTTALARKLGLSRSTVQDRIARLEDRGIIAGYTIRFNEDYQNRLITAHVLIQLNPKNADQILARLRKIPLIKAVYAVSGIYDMIALVKAETTEEIDSTLDEIGRMDGINKTTSSIVLSTKFEI
ncbi:Lrp/AsnC family transcriptional regulator [Paremcibacter congregatus]|uniref:AsnC family transcriptional regulator n=1 Tax=Paremcibacter congregatus TaxID=2043170 RepID=A0A2G4YP27_9PROT|nr:Lrp/AsnC family transcriptional regulator [Paremcibacter congregatus]PHZ84068.1 AsnC family transcriptional regulator [Paremcibacter congregatus]QDE25871.1 Lrp/AsnC family transcriptional regulator [Paremcibacter congregatus]